MSKSIIHTNAAPAAVGPYSQAVVAGPGSTVYLSGQIDSAGADVVTRVSVAGV